MPEISRFLGIVIAMYFNDHAPPHFHAIYDRREATVRIQDGAVQGNLPRRALSHVLEWYTLHRAELMENWHRARERRPLRRIEPLEQAMIPKITSAEYVRDYRIRVRFSDGVSGELDLESELWGEVFAPLKDLAVFRRFRLDLELNTITWPTGADLAPEFLYERASADRGSETDAARPRG